MPKPTVGAMANGCHHNLSLWRGEDNVFADPGNTTLHVSETARHALGGILRHSRGMQALLAPTVNSYARYWDVGQFAPAVVNWGFDNRTCAVRVSASGRLEYKLPDASVNPYISHAAVIEAIADGLEQRIDPGPPESGDSYGAMRLHFAPVMAAILAAWIVSLLRMTSLAVALAPHARQHELAHARQAEDVGLELAPELVEVEALHRAALAVARVVHQRAHRGPPPPPRRPPRRASTPRRSRPTPASGSRPAAGRRSTRGGAPWRRRSCPSWRAAQRLRGRCRSSSR